MLRKRIAIDLGTANTVVWVAGQGIVANEPTVVAISSEDNKVVAVGEQFKITYSVNKKGSSLQVPPFSNFNLLYGPNTSTSSSVQIVNGKMTQEVSYTYTYVVLSYHRCLYMIVASDTISFALNPLHCKLARHC